jgi:hypothetical protein
MGMKSHLGVKSATSGHTPIFRLLACFYFVLLRQAHVRGLTLTVPFLSSGKLGHTPHAAAPAA